MLDPDGILTRGREQRIPFQLTEADTGVDVILLTQPGCVDFRVQTPNGVIIEPWRAMTEPQMQFRLSQNLSFYRLVLPLELAPGRFSQEGTWYALMQIGKPRLRPPDPRPGTPAPGVIPRGGTLVTPPGPSRVIRPEEMGRAGPPESRDLDQARRRDRGAAAAAADGRDRRGLPFSLIVHSYSTLTLQATLVQSAFVPGAKVVIDARLAEFGLPPRPGAAVWAEVRPPVGPAFRVDLTEQEPGRFEGTFSAARAGVYACRIRASGRSRSGYPFHREETRTAAVWFGGDRDPQPGGGPDRDERLCRLLACLLAEGHLVGPELERRLHALGFDLRRLRDCVEKFCPTRPEERPR